ncbi:AMP-binding protein [Streptomyces sp. E-08]|uniref:AMP-binding protein n=1 Tax=Streptomyces sp. E-08 TaxID=3404047 RepID=UPI003CEC74AC
MLTDTTGLSAAACMEDALTLRATPFGHSVEWSDLGIRDDGDLLAALPPRLPFETSGTTGEPVVWWRTREQLVREARHIADLLAAEPADLFVVHAPLRHLYGLLFGCLVPALLGRRAHYARPVDPLPRGAHRPLYVAVPSTWWQLRRSLRELRGYERLTVAHSTAPLPDAAVAVRRAVPRLALLEVHGSTETGMVGTRADGRWDFALAPDVTFAARREVSVAAPSPVPLAVRSPRIAVRTEGPPAPEHVLDDLVTVTGPRTYRLAGRRGGLIKINGRRAGLADIEAVLRGSVPGADLRCVAVPDPVRGEWYEVLVDGTERERRTVAAAALRALPAWQAPRAVRLRASGASIPVRLPSTSTSTSTEENDS